MKLFEVKKLFVATVTILIMATTTFVFWQATPETPASNNGDGNIIIGQDGTFSTTIEIDSTNRRLDGDGNERLVPKEFEGLIKAPEGVTWVYEMIFEFNITWIYDEELGSVVGDQVFNGSLLFTTDLEHDLIVVNISEPLSSITANNGQSVVVVATVTMNMPNSLVEYEAVSGQTISIPFTARVIPDDIASSDESLFIFEPVMVDGGESAYQVRFDHANTSPIKDLIIPRQHKGLPVVIANGGFAGVDIIENVIIPGDVLSIGDAAFDSSSIKSLIVLGSVGSIQSNAFSDTNMQSFIVRGYSLEVKGEAFNNSRITNLLIKANELLLEELSFAQMKPGANIKIVANIESIKETSFNESEYASIVIIGDVGVISLHAFDYLTIKNKTLIIDGDVGILLPAFRLLEEGYTIEITGHIGQMYSNIFGLTSEITQNITLVVGSLGTVSISAFGGTNGMIIYLLNQNEVHSSLNINMFVTSTNLTIYIPEEIVEEFTNRFGSSAGITIKPIV